MLPKASPRSCNFVSTEASYVDKSFIATCSPVFTQNIGLDVLSGFHSFLVKIKVFWKNCAYCLDYATRSFSEFWWTFLDSFDAFKREPASNRSASF